MNTKFCHPCQTELPTSAFGKHSGKPDGLQTQCKACRSAKQAASQSYRDYQRDYSRRDKVRLAEQARKRYAANPEPAKARVKKWREDNPELKKEADRRYREANRDRVNARSREWAKNNRQKRKATVRNYYLAHKEENRIKSAKRRAAAVANGSLPYSKEQLLGKLLVWRYRCYLCNKALDGTLQWDHVKPICVGGPDMLSNLRPVHENCNKRKSGKWPLEI